MTAPELYGWMKHPEALSGDTLPVLHDTVDQFPPFHAATMLYLKNLYTLKDEHFDEELHRLSVFVPDRRKLFLFIEGARYGLLTERQEEQEPVDSFSLIDNFLAKHPSESQSSNELLFQPSVSSDYLTWSLSGDGNKKKDKDRAEKRQPGDAIPAAGKHPTKPLELIDQFLDQAQGPIRLDANETPADTPEAVIQQNEEQSRPMGDSYFTETLARIFIRQKRYEKALQIIQSLSMKYPEKNIYFADQIRFLEKLIINTKK